MSDNSNLLPTQTYVSTRGGAAPESSFETVVLKGLASDGGLFLPAEIPKAPEFASWKDLSYAELAFQILSLYISNDDIPAQDLQQLINRSYSTFRSEDITPLVHLQDDLYLLELFHGPSYSFKDCALQFLGNLFEYFLVRKNEGKTGRDRHHLTVVGATSGDTGSAAIHGLRGKKDVSVFILHPKDRISPIQKAQMVTVPEENVHNLELVGFFDDCQNIVKKMFGDPDSNQHLKLGAVNSINLARILAQIVYYFHSYFQLVKTGKIQLGDKIRYVVPTGNFGNVLAGYFAYKMGLPIQKLVIATNENDILDRFWRTGSYTSDNDCKETLSPAMDILVSSNFERVLYYLAKDHAATTAPTTTAAHAQAATAISAWYSSLKRTGSFGPVDPAIMAAGRALFASERVDDPTTLRTVESVHARPGAYVLDPHSAVAVAAAERVIAATATAGAPGAETQQGQSSSVYVALCTAHPAKFSGAVERALAGHEGFDFAATVLPDEFKDLLKQKERVTTVNNSWEEVRELIKKRVDEELTRLESL